MDKRHLMADLAIVEIVNADKRNWTWEKAEVEDGEFWVPQGSHLGNTTINLGDTYETSGDDCLYVQTACENYPEVLRRAIDAEERIQSALDRLSGLIAGVSMAGGAGEPIDAWGLSSELVAIATELNGGVTND